MAKEVVSAPRFYGSSLRRVRSRAACSNGYIISSLKTFWVDPTPFCVEGSTLRPAIQFCFRKEKQWTFPKDSNLRDLAQTDRNSTRLKYSQVDMSYTVIYYKTH